MKQLAAFTALLALLLILSGCGAMETALPTLSPTENISPEALPAQERTGESPTALSTQPPASQRLTAGEVRTIALSHAGIPEDQLRFLRLEYEMDDGIPRYEVEFVTDDWEYEYEIHAETGEILSYDKDRD